MIDLASRKSVSAILKELNGKCGKEKFAQAREFVQTERSKLLQVPYYCSNIL